MLEIGVTQIGSRFGSSAGFNCSVLGQLWLPPAVLSIAETICFSSFKGKMIPLLSGRKGWQWNKRHHPAAPSQGSLPSTPREEKSRGLLRNLHTSRTFPQVFWMLHPLLVHQGQIPVRGKAGLCTQRLSLLSMHKCGFSEIHGWQPTSPTLPSPPSSCTEFRAAEVQIFRPRVLLFGQGAAESAAPAGTSQGEILWGFPPLPWFLRPWG